MNRKTTTLPSTFLKSCHSAKNKKIRAYTYDRDILLLPSCLKDSRGLVKIPRGESTRELLAANGLVGRICLTSGMTEDDIFSEIRSVFSIPMDGDPHFPIKILQMSGGGSKTLTVPVVSSTYTWTASAVVGKNAKTPIYVLAEDKLKV